MIIDVIVRRGHLLTLTDQKLKSKYPILSQKPTKFLKLRSLLSVSSSEQLIKLSFSDNMRKESKLELLRNNNL